MSKELMDDLLFTELLYSPGYEVEFAVGTTYSLSLEALLRVPLAFGMLDDRDDDSLQNPCHLLSAIKNSAEKFCVYHNLGQISVPKEDKRVFGLLENSIFSIKNKEMPTANFHPKVWIIKEHNKQDKDDEQIKVIVMSRNLTRDTSLDVAVSMVSKLEKDIIPEYKAKHEPLKKFLKFLAKPEFTTNENKRKKIKSLIQDIDHLGKFELDGPFEGGDYDFYPMLYKKTKGSAGLGDLKEVLQGTSMLVVSPFIDYKSLEALFARCQSSNEKVLITRREYVDKKIFELCTSNGGEIWVVSDSAMNTEFGSMNLHAKTYFVSHPENDTGHYLYLGSANATHSAFNRNVEFLVGLKFARSTKYFENVRDAFLKRNEGYFEQCTQPFTESAETEKFGNLTTRFKEILCNGFSAKVVPSNTNYSIQVKLNNPIDSAIKLEIATLQKSSNFLTIQDSVLFENLSLSQLSEFFILKASDGTEEISPCVVKICVQDMPLNRDSEIVKNIVDTKEKFIDYVSLIAAAGSDDMAGVLERISRRKEKSKKVQGIVTPALYENMLRMVFEDPERLEQIEKFVKEMDGSDVVDESFKRMLKTFKNVVDKENKK